MERTGYDILMILIQRKMLEHVDIPKKIEIHCQDIENLEKMQIVVKRYLN